MEVRDTIYGKDRLPLVVQAYPIPAQGTPDYYAVDMLNQVLSGGESARLNQRVVENDQLALFCGAFSFGLEDPGFDPWICHVQHGRRSLKWKLR